MNWPTDLEKGKIRIIEVPWKIHKKMPNSDKMPIFEYIAKNVGIRRAKGEYVLATNPDLLFNEELISFLAKKEFSSGCYYRADRYDVRKLIPIKMSIEEKLRFCEKYWFRLNKIYGTKYRLWNLLLNLKFSDCLKFLRVLRTKLKKTTKKHSSFSFAGFKNIYTNTSGDFFLMAKSQWHKLKGYPELKTHSYIDGYICFMAVSTGLFQVILNDKKRIYHQEHGRAEAIKRPFTNYQHFMKDSKKMITKKKPLILNDQSWGLGRLKLKEYTI